MSNIASAWIMISLDVLMIIYTLWALALFKPIGKIGITVAMLAWLGALRVDVEAYSRRR